MCGLFHHVVDELSIIFWEFSKIILLFYLTQEKFSVYNFYSFKMDASASEQPTHDEFIQDSTSEDSITDSSDEGE